MAQGHARHIHIRLLRQVEAQTAPARTDVQNPVPRAQQKLRRQMRLLPALRRLDIVIVGREIGAAVLPVAVQEQVEQLRLQVVMVRDLAPRRTNRIVRAQTGSRNFRARSLQVLRCGRDAPRAGSPPEWSGSRTACRPRPSAARPYRLRPPQAAGLRTSARLTEESCRRIVQPRARPRPLCYACFRASRLRSADRIGRAGAATARTASILLSPFPMPAAVREAEG